MKNALLLFAGMVSISSASTIAIARGIGNPGIIPIDTNNTLLNNSAYYIGVGTFVSEPVITSTNDLSNAVNSLFLEYGSVVDPTTRAPGGILSGRTTSLGGTTPENFNQMPIYLVIGNGATKATSTEFAIIKSTNTNTLFPANVADSSTANFSTKDVTSIIVINNAGTAIDNATGSDNIRLVSIVPIPEASTALLGVAGALSLLRRRRLA